MVDVKDSNKAELLVIVEALRIYHEECSLSSAIPWVVNSNKGLSRFQYLLIRIDLYHLLSKLGFFHVLHSTNEKAHVLAKQWVDCRSFDVILSFFSCVYWLQ